MSRHNTNCVRIIGGRWRGRKIQFSPQMDLRPTGDRIRETLFNWLAPYLAGGRCLDLFAGSGVLGFEALSRGASHVTFIDQSVQVCSQLRQTTEQLHATGDTIIQASLPAALRQLSSSFDIVLLDPPFASPLLTLCLQELIDTDCLADNALIYIEYNPKLAQPTLPPHWQLWRAKQAGQVHYELWRSPKY
jgi:16S rRNA (guanine966-N2)-methyltransferase